MNLDDPKLTAFALDELAEPQKSEIARAVASSPEAQREVEDIRRLTRALRKEFNGGVEGRAPASPASQSSALHADGVGLSHSLSDIRADRWFWTVARPLSIAATIAVLGLIGVIVFSGRRLHINPNHSTSTEIELVDSAPRDKSGADSVPNPLQIDLIDSIDHVVVGELAAGDVTGEKPARVIEVIRDSTRLAKLKSRLTIPALRNVSSGHVPARSYQVIFLDREEHTIACATFSCANQKEALLRLLPKQGNSPLPGDWQSQTDYSVYAMPFPDWKEAIGYCPGSS